MKQRTILDSTSNLLHTIGGGMYNVSHILKQGLRDVGRFEDLVTDSRLIESKFGALESSLTKSYYFIIDEWNYIKDNQMRLFEVSDFMKSCLTFKTRLTDLEVSCTDYKNSTQNSPDNDLTLAEYFLLMRRFEKKYERIFSYVSTHTAEVTEEVSLYIGLSEVLKEYISGGNDLKLEELISEHIPPDRKMKWIGPRNEATLFGEYFSLPCRLMNDSFIFRNRSNDIVRPNYSQYKPTNSIESYRIYNLISKFRAGK